MKNFIRFLFFFSVFISSSLYAAPNTCPGGDYLTNIHNASSDQNDTEVENSTGSGTYRVFTFTPLSGGEMTVSFLAPEKQTIEIGTTCGGVEIDKDTSGSLSYTHTFYAKAGTQYYVKIEEKNGSNALEFTANFQFKAIKVAFEKAVYNISEDLNIADGATQALALNINLTHAVTFDITVTYNTMEASPPSATSGIDFKALTDSVTFLAGETQKIAYVDIVHDVPVELEENFYVELSNIATDLAYTDVVGFGDNNPAEIIILEQTLAQTCFEDDFSAAFDDDWRLLYSSNEDDKPEIVNGRLRMTTAKANIATAVTKDWEFAASENLITVEFDHFAYDGSGADGFAIVLYDSSIGASPNPGAFGGSLGYAQKDAALSDATVDTPGFEGGWLGLGLDEYGNFAKESEGRIGGLSSRVPHNVTLRGKGSGQTGYAYLDGTASSGSLNPVLWKTDVDYSGGRFKLTIDSRDTAHVFITLERDGTVIINKFDAIGSQGASPDYIRLAVTASTGGSNAIHELDDLLVTGVCRAYGANAPEVATGFVDAVDITYTDATYTDASGPDIKTKISNKGSYNFETVYLGDDTVGVEVYAPPSGTFDTMPLTVEITLSDSNCTSDIPLTSENGDPYGWAEIEVGTSSAVTINPVTFPAIAMSDARLKFKAVDWNSLFASFGVSTSCSVSSTTGSLCGVPSCLGSATQAETAFPIDATDPDDAAANQHILEECYGQATAGDGSIGTNSPCNGTNYNGSCGGTNDTKTILPDKYSTTTGCLACILDKLSTPTCSVDHFAIRPEKFNLSSTHANMPSLVRAGQDYNLTVTATDYDIDPLILTPTQDYNQSSDNLDTSGLTKWENSPRVINNSLNGAASLGDFNITNGTSTYNGTSGEVASFSYTDVGFITLSVQDTNWSSIDSEDTAGDCTSDGRYICGDKNITVIPHHFSLQDVNLSNNNGLPGTFTYIANLDDTNQSTFSMAARVQVTIVAQNESNGTTLNFQTGAAFYENQVTLDLNASNLNHGDANATSILNALLGFGTGTDTNGTKTIVTHDDTNLSVVLRFNFPRDVNNSLNPFQVFASDVNLSITSTYTQAAVGAYDTTANIIGSNVGLGDGNATIIYGRTNGPNQRFVGPTGNAFIYYEAHCNGTDTVGITCNKSLLPNGVDSNSTNDPRWFKNTLHDVAISGNVGSVTQKSGAGFVTLSAGLTNITGRTTVPLVYNPSPHGYPYKTTMENNASTWLIYNKYNINADANEFQVEFVNSTGDWAGEANTTITTDSNVTRKTNRRSMW